MQIVIWNKNVFSKQMSFFKWKNRAIWIFRNNQEGKKGPCMLLVDYVRMKSVWLLYSASLPSDICFETIVHSKILPNVISAYLCFGYIHQTSNSSPILSIPVKNLSDFWLCHWSLLCCVQIVKFCWEFSFGLTHHVAVKIWFCRNAESMLPINCGIIQLLKWWHMGPMTSNFRLTKIWGREGGWRTQRSIIYIKCDTSLWKITLGILIKSKGITPNFFGMETEVKTGEKWHIYKHCFCFLHWTGLRQFESLCFSVNLF